ncbi:hypothetical protein [Sphingomonas hankyongi]|uniref:Uncharacterized protein n=1 Tax=Sphingomonas hankyongi TaxID=2908209 RepID=A0ABT0S2K5_9SPHN|nr:hypothetical protein [Sphingomonas hankyongi]MCL6729785.1 hypothetical protein [Sphingomonas hankyongi]
MLQKLSEGQRRTIAHWAMEFVVVVAGVLLALWLQEMVARAGQREAAKAAEDAIHAEYDYNLTVLLAMNVLVDCQSTRLKEIEAALANPKSAKSIGEDYFDDGKQRAYPGIYTTFDADIADMAWQSAQANGTLSGIAQDRYRILAGLHDNFQAIERATGEDADAARDLQVLRYNLPLSADRRGELLGSMSILSQNLHSRATRFAPSAIAQEFKRVGWNDKAEIDKRIAEWKSGMKSFGVTLKACAKPVENPFAAQPRHS